MPKMNLFFMTIILVLLQRREKRKTHITGMYYRHNVYDVSQFKKIGPIVNVKPPISLKIMLTATIFSITKDSEPHS